MEASGLGKLNDARRRRHRHLLRETQALFGVSLSVRAGGAGPARRQWYRQDHRASLHPGLTRALRGDIRFQGRSILAEPTHAIARSGIGWVPDDRRLCPTLTVAKNLILGQKRTAFRSWSMGEVTDIFTPLKYLMSREAETLSGGEMQMVAIARALLGAPGLMLFDEPSQGLAPKIVDDVLGVIRKLKDTGIGSVIVEQNADVALGVADRVVVLAHGQVAWSGDANTLAADPGLKRELLGGLT